MLKRNAKYLQPEEFENPILGYNLPVRFDSSKILQSLIKWRKVDIGEMLEECGESNYIDTDDNLVKTLCDCPIQVLMSKGCQRKDIHV